MKVFLQYSWDSEPHKEWVLELANRLTSDGVDLYFDRYDLRVGSNNLHFMEQIELSHKVILIMSSGYKSKANNRSGGIGYEYQIMSGEIAAELASNQKFIPVLRDGDAVSSIPKLLHPFLYLDMRDDKLFEQQYLELLHLIYDEPLVKRPKLGKKPLLGKVSVSTNEIKKDRQLIALNKVHDIVASSLYKLMVNIESDVESDREKLLDKIENMYEKSRDISYDKSEFIEPEFHETIYKLLSSFENDNFRITITGNEASIWAEIGKRNEYEIKTIMQEIMTNMIKYSKGNQVHWGFEREKNLILISYSDNGIVRGIEQIIEDILKNLKMRLNLISGKLDYNSVFNEIRIQIPTKDNQHEHKTIVTSNYSNPKFEVFKSSRNSEYYYRLKSVDGQIILTGGGYTTKQNCLNSIVSVKINALYDQRYERKKNIGGYSFNLKAGNGEVIGRSESYITVTRRENGIAAIKLDVLNAVIEELV